MRTQKASAKKISDKTIAIKLYNNIVDKLLRDYPDQYEKKNDYVIKDLIGNCHKYIEDIEWIELWFLKLLKPKAYKLFIQRLKDGYSYYYAIKELRTK